VSIVIGDRLRQQAVEMILHERERQIGLGHGGNTDGFDMQNSQNDWLAYIQAYLGRAANKCARNVKDGQHFAPNLVKAGALILAALEAHAKGYCPEY